MIYHEDKHVMNNLHLSIQHHLLNWHHIHNLNSQYKFHDQNIYYHINHHDEHVSYPKYIDILFQEQMLEMMMVDQMVDLTAGQTVRLMVVQKVLHLVVVLAVQKVVHWVVQRVLQLEL